MDKQNREVEKIINYLEGKIAALKEKLARYDSPIMQDMTKTSPHLQMDYVRVSSELQANQDNLLAIQTFSSEKLPVKGTKKDKENGDKKE